MNDKRTQLLALAKTRQATSWDRYNCIGDYHGGIYECDYVSPYSKTAGNIDADVMVMLQDWDSDEGLLGPIDEDARTLGYTKDFPTNRNLWSSRGEVVKFTATADGRSARYRQGIGCLNRFSLKICAGETCATRIATVTSRRCSVVLFTRRWESISRCDGDGARGGPFR